MKNNENNKNNKLNENAYNLYNEPQSTKLSKNLSTNIVNLRSILNDTADLTIKYAVCAGCDIAVITCEGMVNTQVIASILYAPLMSLEHTRFEPDDLMNKLKSHFLVSVDQQSIETTEDLVAAFVNGFVVILADNSDQAIGVAAQGFNTRSVEKPIIHSNMRSSNEGFTENLKTNITLVRRRVKSPALVVKNMKIGSISQTNVSLCFLSDKADMEMISQIEKRLESIPLEIVLEGGYIEPFLQDGGNSLFTQVGMTDRPDSFVAKLYDGRAGVIIDGTPCALFLPLLFAEHFQTMDDYSGMTIFATFNRWLKYISFFISVLLPGLFVALSNFNPELFPPTFLFNMVSAEQKTPFTVFAECLLVIAIYEVLREAGLRLPVIEGHAVNIIGGLVLGDIVVSVGLISAPVVLVVALSAILSFLIPDIYPTIVILRLSFILVGGLFGIFGITVLGIVILFKVCSMSSYGVPYTAPITPFTLKAMRDYFVRLSFRKLAVSDVNINTMNGVKKK